MAPPHREANASSSKDPLPPKENAMFKKMISDYEHKKYKHGIKLAKQILSDKRWADHGETLAMKGLILNSMGKREEGQADVKRGLLNDMRSHVCWHVFGLIQRSDKKYEEAIKAYRHALKADPDNMQILRDLSILLVHMRDMNGYRDIRYHLLTLRPTQRASWIGYAMSYHLLGNHEMALKILKQFEEQTDLEGGFDYEQSELLLYTNMIMREGGMLQEAVNHLDENSTLIYDKVQFLEEKAKCLQLLNRPAEAISVYNQLVNRNPENVAYYAALEECKGLRSNSEVGNDVTVGPDFDERRLAIYDAVAERYPRAAACKRIPLTFLKGARFIERLRPFLIAGFRKGVPAMFQQLRKAYNDPARVIIIQQMVLTFVKSLESTSRFPEDNEAGEESPTTILWVYYYAAQHFDNLGEEKQAHFYIDRALSHTPTLIELIVSKAKFYKHSGDDQNALRLMDTAQAMDTADRFINSKCAKYMLRAGQVEQAVDMCAKFTREGVNAAVNMNEMQCMWYANEAAIAYKKRGELGEALKKCHEVDRHFTYIVEDQYDFHTYCVRKMTICAYVRLLRLEDTLREHRYFYRAAILAIQIYIHLHDTRSSGATASESDGVSAGELRKAARKAKKQQAKADEERAVIAAKEAKENKKKPADIEDDDVLLQPLDPTKLVNTAQPLEEAMKFVRPLTTLFNKNVDAHVLSFDVYYRLDKVLPMLQCLVSAAKLSPNDAQLHVRRAKFLLYESCHSSAWSPLVRDCVTECLPILFPNTRDVHTLNTTFAQANENLWPVIVANLECEHYIAVHEKRESTAVKRLIDVVDKRLHSVQACDWQSCVDLLQRLSTNALGPLSGGELTAMKSRMSARFPSCNALQTTKTTASTPVQSAVNGVADLSLAEATKA